MQIDREQWSVLSSLLDQALELSPAEREPWLEALSGEHVTLKDTLRELLHHHAQAETHDFLDTTPKVQGTEVGPGGAPAPATLMPGMQVGPYVIEEEIGRGGMGAVWRARRGDGVIKRQVALKLPHVGLYGRDLIERFARERDILSGLAHTHIARLYDAGFASSGQPFLALEYVPGVPLPKYCDHHRLDVRRRLKLFQQVLRAVRHAHAQLVIHRDIKPSNVIVGPDGLAMLLDFGIAKLVTVDAADEAGHTQFAAALTPDYASPEQIRGEPVSTASDIYSLGVLLFEVLTGARPYQLARRSRRELEDAILNRDPPRPSQCIPDESAAAARGATLKGLSRALNGDLDTIVLTALKKAPAERYATVDAFLQDIDHYLRGEPVAARRDSGWYRAHKFVTRHRLPVALGALALAVILSFAAVAFLEAHKAAVERDRALALSERNEAVTQFLNTLITESAGSEKPMTVSDMLARSEALVSSEYHNNPEQQAAVLGMLGMYYHTNGEDTRAEPLLRKALDAIRSASDDDLRRKLTCDHAMAASALGKVAESTRSLHAVIDDPRTSAQQAAECLQYLAYMAQDASDGESALKYGNLALERLREVKNPSKLLEAAFLGSIGYAEHLNGRNDVAQQFYGKSLAQFAAAGRDRSPDAISVRNNWAVVSDGAGNPRRSLELYEQTLKIVAQNDPGATPPPYLVANRAHALESLGRYREATQGYSQCVALSGQASSVANHAYCLLGLVSVAQQSADLAAVEDYLRKATTVISPAVPAGYPADLALRVARARLALARGNAPAARTELDAVLATSKGGSATAAALSVRSELNLRDGKLADAEADARRVLSMVQAAQGGLPHSNRTGLAWLTLGKVLASEGNAAGAREAFQAAVTHLSNTVDAGHPMLRQARQRLAN